MRGVDSFFHNKKSNSNASFIFKLGIIILLLSFIVFAQETDTTISDEPTEKVARVIKGPVTQEKIIPETQELQSLLKSHWDEEDLLFFTANKESSENESNDEEPEITLGNSAEWSGNEIVEITSTGIELTKNEYVTCRKIKYQIETDSIQRNEVSSNMQSKCVDIFNHIGKAEIRKREAKELEDQRVEEYYETNNYFNNLEFEGITEQDEVTTVSKKGDIKGYILNESQYVFDVLHCDQEKNGCYFRVNGTITPLLEPNNEKTLFRFGDKKQYFLRLETVKFYVCQGKRFCDYGVDTVDLVTFTIKRN